MSLIGPKSLLEELNKYLKIVEVSKKAIYLNQSGENTDSVKEELKVLLDNCGFTSITGGTEPKVPLYSATAYLDDVETLAEQVAQADAYAKVMLQKIKESVGPFYEESEIRKMQIAIDERLLEGTLWSPGATPIKVTTYKDDVRELYIQVDWEHLQYRSAKDSEEFGPWKSFTA